MDKPGADFEQAMETVRDRLKGNPVPVCYPLEDCSVINLVDETHITFSGEKGETVTIGEIPAQYEELVMEQREIMVMMAAEQDEELEELVLMEEPYTNEQVWAALAKGTLEGTIQPTFCRFSIEELWSTSLTRWRVENFTRSTVSSCLSCQATRW